VFCLYFVELCKINVTIHRLWRLECNDCNASQLLIVPFRVWIHTTKTLTVHISILTIMICGWKKFNSTRSLFAFPSQYLIFYRCVLSQPLSLNIRSLKRDFHLSKASFLPKTINNVYLEHVRSLSFILCYICYIR